MRSFHKIFFKTPLLALDCRILDLYIIDHLISRKKQAPLSMAIGNGKLIHECPPKHSCMEQQEQNKNEKAEEKGIVYTSIYLYVVANVNIYI